MKAVEITTAATGGAFASRWRRGNMIEAIRNVTVVSDGILVEFDCGTTCYYPATFLQAHIGLESNQVFLPYDPTPMETFAAAPMPALVALQA